MRRTFNIRSQKSQKGKPNKTSFALSVTGVTYGIVSEVISPSTSEDIANKVRIDIGTSLLPTPIDTAASLGGKTIYEVLTNE